MSDFNLDELIQDNDTVSFNGKDKNGQKIKYTVEMKIPFEAGIIISENIQKIAPIFKGFGISKINKDIMNIMLRIIESVFMEQYHFMNKEYIKKQFSLLKLITITKTLVTPIIEYINDMDLPTETPKP